MRIVICSAQEQVVSRLRQLAAAWAILTCADVSIVERNDFPSHAEEEGGIYFLDASGTHSRTRLVKAAECLAARSDCAFFLCVPDSRTAIDCYSLHPDGLLCSPFCPDEMLRAMSRCVNLWWDGLRRLELLSDRMKVVVPLYDLVWIESVSKSCLLHCTDSQIQVRLPLNALEVMLPRGLFLRCQRSFIVNLCHIRAAGRTEITLSDGAKIPMGRALRNQVLKAYESVCSLRAGNIIAFDDYENNFCCNL